MSLPPYTDYPTLNAGAIILRQIGPQDIDDIIEISFYDGQPAANAAEALDMLRRIHHDYAAGDSIHWGIADADSGAILGTCGYYRGFANASGELGCVMRPAYRGRGIMTLALRAAIEFGFSAMGLERVTAVTTRQNGSAIRLLERLQMEKVAARENDVLEYAFMKTIFYPNKAFISRDS